jgi:hypothetical protein
MISEVARGVLAEMEAQLDALRSNLDLVDRYQQEVFERQLEAEERQGDSFVSDRAFCNLAYAAHHSRILARIASDPRLERYMASVRAGLAWEEVLRIDGMVKLLLEMFGVPYIPVESLAMQERVRLIERVLSLAGLSPVGAPSTGSGERAREILPARRTGNGHAVGAG